MVPPPPFLFYWRREIKSVSRETGASTGEPTRTVTVLCPPQVSEWKPSWTVRIRMRPTAGIRSPT